MPSGVMVSLGSYLVFEVGGERFALAVAGVREVLEMVPLTQLPDMPTPAAGVLNLRGSAVAVFDLRRLLGLAGIATGERPNIIVMERPEGEAMALAGLVVDAVRGVTELTEGDLHPAPRLREGRQEIVAMVDDGEGRFLQLLDPLRIWERLGLNGGDNS